MTRTTQFASQVVIPVQGRSSSTTESNAQRSASGHHIGLGMARRNSLARIRAGAWCRLAVLALATLVLVSCDSGGSSSSSANQPVTGISLDEGSVYTLLEGRRYDVSTGGGGSGEATVTQWSWSADPIAAGPLSQCSSVSAGEDTFNTSLSANSLEEACAIPNKCSLSFDQVTAASEGTSQTRFSLQVPILKAPVGLTYQLEAINTLGQRTVRNATFCLISINESPVANNDVFTVIEGEELVVRAGQGISLLSNDSDDIDAGNAPLTVLVPALAGPSLPSTFSLSENGGFRYNYTPASTLAGGNTIEDTFQYQITDGTYIDTATVTLRIVTSDKPPQQIADLPTTTFISGIDQSLDLSTFFADPESSELLFAGAFSPALPSGSLSVDDLGVLSGTATNADVGVYTLTVSASDQRATVSGSLQLTVQGNRPPVFSSLPTNVTVAFGQLLSLDASPFVSDPENESLTWSVSTEPASSLVINPESGLITGQLSVAGNYTVFVGATDGTGQQVVRSFTVTQQEAPNQAPVIVSDIQSSTVTVGTAIQPLSGDFTDPDGDVLSYTISSLPAGLLFDQASGVLSGIPTALGQFPLRIVASDSDGLTAASNLFTLTVSAIPNNAPVFAGAIANRTFPIAEPIAAFSGIFTDADTDDVLTYSASGLPAGLTINSTTGEVTGVPTVPGTFAASISVADSEGASATSNTFEIVVEPAPDLAPVITGTTPASAVSLQAGTTATVSVTATDENTATLSYSATVAPAGVVNVSATGSGAFGIEALVEGSATLTLIVTDDTGKQATDTVQITVTAIPNTAPVITGRTPTGNVTLNPGQQQSLTVLATDEEPASLAYSADSANTSVAAVQSNGDADGIVITAGNVGATTVTLTVEDAQGLTDTTTVNVIVEALPNTAPNVVSRSPSGAVTLLPGDSDSVTLTVQDESVASLTYSVSSSATGVATATIDNDGEITIVAVAEGSAVVTVEIEDDLGLTTEETIPVTVNAIPNDPPEITTINPSDDLTLTVGDTESVQLTVTDEDIGSLVYLQSSSDDDVAEAESDGQGGYTIEAKSEGSATLTLIVEDIAGERDSVSLDVDVEEIPNAAPVIGSVQPSDTIELVEGESATVALTVSDESPATLVFDSEVADAQTASASINSNNTITVEGLAPGTTTVTIEVTDNANQTDTVDLDVTVTAANVAPQITAVTPDEVTGLVVGETASLVVTIDDESVATVQIDAASDDEDIVIAVVDATGSISLTPVAEGSTAVSIEITDNAGETDSVDVAVTVVSAPEPEPEPEPANVAPTIASVTPSGDLMMLVGDERSLVFSVTDEDVPGLTYTTAFSIADVAAVTDSGDGVFSVTALDVGTTELTVTVTDTELLTADETISITVDPA